MVGPKIKINPQNAGPKTPDTGKNELSASVYIKCRDSIDLPAGSQAGVSAGWQPGGVQREGVSGHVLFLIKTLGTQLCTACKNSPDCTFGTARAVPFSRVQGFSEKISNACVRWLCLISCQTLELGAQAQPRVVRCPQGEPVWSKPPLHSVSLH